MACEYMLDEDMQRGYLQGAASCVESGMATPEQASALIDEATEKINRVPAYVRHAHKALTKALREHDQRAGIVDAPSA